MADDYERVKARADLKEYAEKHLKRARSGHKYVCPVCNSGGGDRDSDSAFSITADGKRWTCFGSCGGKGGDIFDLAGIINNTTDRAEQLQIVATWAGIVLENDRGNSSTSSGGGFANSNVARQIVAEANAKAEERKQADPAPDYSEGREKHRRYIAECARRMVEEPDEQILSYLSARGITYDEAVTLGIGYDPKPAHGWKDEAGNWHNSPRIVLPWLGCDYYHIDRAIDARAKNGKYNKPSAEEVGPQPLYNPDAFSHDYVVVVEGVLDAIAVQLCGFNAVALGGTASNNFANEAAARNYAGVVIDMLDADGEKEENGEYNKGRGAGADLVSLLAEAGVHALSRADYGVSEADDYGGHKDAAEWFAADRADLAEMLDNMRAKALDNLQREKEAGYREAMRRFNVKNPAVVARDVLELRGVYEPVPTGITSLDAALDGGLNLGELTIFGAVSSYGKTTMAVQIADYMASSGRSVLFVSVEQSAKEIVAKSLSRLVYTENLTGWNIATPTEITSLKARKAWGEGQNDVLASAVECYNRLIAPNMLILEGTERPSVKDIRQFASMMADHNGKAPVIFLDYLQLLSPLSERYDDKKNVDVNVSELRKMARDLNTHIWAISSLNRASYSGVISLDSYKESGGIEFGADNLLGLQPRDMAAQLDDVPETKRKRVAEKFTMANKSKMERDCELVILKRRNGAIPNDPVPLTFKTMAACFIEPKGTGTDGGKRARTVL